MSGAEKTTTRVGIGFGFPANDHRCAVRATLTETSGRDEETGASGKAGVFQRVKVPSG
jgi:hypothetical protein